MEWHRAAWTTALAIALLLVTAEAASAFRFKSCVSAVAAPGCTIGNAGALNDPRAVVVSPDGRHVYSAAFEGDAIGVFARDPSSGALRFRSCVSANGAGPCAIIRPGGHLRALNGARALVMSPDGMHLYAAAFLGDAVTTFRRNPDTGALTFAGCMTSNNEDQGICIGIHSGALAGPAALAVSPDGDEVYVAAEGGDSIGYFSRNVNNGLLAFFSCRGAASLCTALSPVAALDAPSALAVSRDGRFLYTGARDGDALATFRPDTALNTLTFLGCIGPSGCTSIGNSNALNGPESLVLSPDNRFVYAAAGAGNAVAAFVRNRDTGAVSFAGCDGTTNLGPCAPIGNGNALTGPTALAAGPAGSRVYGAASSGDAIASFARVASGNSLAFLGCIGATASGPCTSANNGAALNAPAALAASLDGRHLYVAARNGDALGVIGVARPACSPVSALTPFNTAIRVRLVCGDPDGGDAVRFSVARPANGTLSQFDPVRGTVVFTPSPGFSGQGVFDFTASDTDGSTAARATIGVGQRPVVPPRPRTRRLDPPVQNRWAYNRTHTWILRLRVRRVPGDAKVQVRCKAPKRLGRKACPFKRKSAKPKRHGATVDVRKLFGKRTKLRVGVKIQIRITAPGAIGKVVTYKLRPKKIPRSTGRCLAPGASKPTKC